MKRTTLITLLAAAALLSAVAAHAATSAAPARPGASVHAGAAPSDGPGDDLAWDEGPGFDDDFDAIDAAGPGPNGPPRYAGGGGPWGGRDMVRPLRPRGGMGMGMGPGGMRGGMRGGPGGPLVRFARQLGLSETQRGKLRDLHERQARKDIQARADMQIARLDLRRLMTAEKPDPVAINTQIDRVSRMRADMQKSHVATMLEARSVLTAEQQQKLRELRENPPAMRGGMRGERGGERDGAAPDAQ